jgi:hypothetical protein
VQQFLGKGTKAGSKEHAKGTHERVSDDVTVYTTAYGTQYVLPLDLLFSRAELLGFLEDARAKVRQEKERNVAELH